MHCDRLTENYLWRGKLKIHEKVEETGRSKSQMREEETGWRSELGTGEAEGFSEMEGEAGPDYGGREVPAQSSSFIRRAMRSYRECLGQVQPECR